MIEQPPTIEETAQPQATAQPVGNPQMPPAQPVQPTNLVNSPMRRSPFLAAALSMMPGLGQVYLGYYQLGFVNAIVICTILTLLATDSLGPLIPLASIFMAFFWLYNIVDAFRRAVIINEALAGRADIELPKDFATPGLRGSIFGGAVLMAVGLVLLGNTVGGFSLEWIEDWWPVAIIGFGGYLILKAMVAKSSGTEEVEDEA